MFAWDNPPETGHPGEAYNCRCWAEPVSSPQSNEIDDPPIEPVYPEAILVPAILGRRVILAGSKRIVTAIGKIFDPVAKRPEGVPKEWVKERTEDGRGYIYKDPKSKRGGTYVKVSKGNPQSTNPGQQVDNVRVQINGQSFDKYGNKVPRQSLESHIPLEEFEKFDPRKFK